MTNRWETIETVTDFILGSSKITANIDCSHEIKRCLFLGRKAMKNQESVLKSKDITLPTKLHLVTAMVFQWSCTDGRELGHKEGWAPKNWCFQIVVLEKTLESPFDCKEIQPVHSKGDQPWVFLEGMMLKLKLQYFGHLMRRLYSLEKTDPGRN